MELNRFQREFKRRIDSVGFQTYNDDKQLSIEYDGNPVGHIVENELFYKKNIDERLRYQLKKMYRDTKEYITAYEHSITLPKEVQVPEGYRILAACDQCVLAAIDNNEYGFHFTTWNYDFTREYFYQGHCFNDNYEKAKLDFVKRSGFVDERIIFRDSQLQIIQTAMKYMDENDICIQNTCLEDMEDIREHITYYFRDKGIETEPAKAEQKFGDI